MMFNELTLKALQSAHKRALAKLKRVKIKEDNAIHCASRLIELRISANELIQSGEYKTKQGLSKLNEMAKREKELISHSKLNLVKVFDEAFSAEMEVNELIGQIHNIKFRLNRVKTGAA
ncbi:hypothetical protein [Rheinheimera salexigens]|uniref:Uncharacterized protein n=1 Tax=Rheinheimera salexigens TaxID=1628148 RepID=A0A1E7Q871_9GAMM|nr:hypothetical protein [Rheinheimera salexigens]OEY70369.1 hypothetical protein BI198_12880 [Rheinheimera salexigens]